MVNTQIEDNVLDGRCRYCGRRKKPCEFGCSPKCVDRYDKLVQKRMNEGLCPQCGNPVYTNKQGKKFAVCHGCLMANTRAMDSIGKMLKELKRGDGC